MISQIWKATTAKQMKIYPHCRDKIVAHCMCFSAMYRLGPTLTFLGVSPLGGEQSHYSERKWRFSSSTRENISQTANTDQ